MPAARADVFAGRKADANQEDWLMPIRRTDRCRPQGSMILPTARVDANQED
jgi:hypothetical protein